MKHTVWDQRYSGRNELSQDDLLRTFDPSGLLDSSELSGVLELVAKTSETPAGKLRPEDEFDEIFYPAPTWNIFRGLHMAAKVFDSDVPLADALRERCKRNNLPIPKDPIMTLQDYVTVWFGAQGKAA